MGVSKKGNPWHDERGRFCSGPRDVSVIGTGDGCVVYGGYDTEAVCEKLGIMPSYDDIDEPYDERAPGGAYPETEVVLNDDNTGEVFVSYMGREYSETFSEADGEAFRAFAERQVKESVAPQEVYERRNKNRKLAEEAYERGEQALGRNREEYSSREEYVRAKMKFYEQIDEEEYAKENSEIATSLMAKDKITKIDTDEYVNKLKRHKGYREALRECDKKADEYNEVAVPLQKKLNDYDKAVDEGRVPEYDYEELRKESARARRLYENYCTADRKAAKYEGDLRRLNTKLAESEGKNPAFFNGAVPRKSMTTVTMPYHGPHATKGFREEVTDEKSKEFQMTLSEAAAIRGESREETLARFREVMGDKEKTAENYGKAFEQIYKEKQGDLLALDIETNSLSPAQGNIIEFGCVDKDGNEFNRLYSPTKRQMKANGVGMTEIHNISEDMVEGKRTFRSDSKNILGMMKGKTILVHNKGFELNWFRQQVPGFAEAEANGEIKVVDTMHICQKFCDTKRNRLQDFVEHTGGKYENAHRSCADAEMTLKALKRWLTIK